MRIRVIAVDHEDEIAKMTRDRAGARHRSGSDNSLRAPANQGSAAYELSKKFGAAPAHAVELAAAARTNWLQGRHVPSMSAARSRIQTPMNGRCARRLDAQPRWRAAWPASMSAGVFPPNMAMIPRRKKPKCRRLANDVAAAQRHQGVRFRRCAAGGGAGPRHRRRAFSLIVRVLLRKGRRLYINDGIWASLSDSWTGKITLPARFIPDPAKKHRNGEAKEHRAVQGMRRHMRLC